MERIIPTDDLGRGPHIAQPPVCGLKIGRFEAWVNAARFNKPSTWKSIKDAILRFLSIFIPRRYGKVEEPTHQASPEWDWRAFPIGYVTPAKLQDPISACVAFSIISAAESVLRIKGKHICLQCVDLSLVDLSEGDFFSSTTKRTWLNRLNRGWGFRGAFRRASWSGLCLEQCHPWSDDPQDLACLACKGKSGAQCPPLIAPVPDGCCCQNTSRVYLKARKTNNEAVAKEWIVKYGPLVAGMKAYMDFRDFHPGPPGEDVYVHVEREYECPSYDGSVYMRTDNTPDDHAVCIVGYSDKGQYWIVKNSWGDKWGDKGFAKVAYGEGELGKASGFYRIELKDAPPSLMERLGISLK